MGECCVSGSRALLRIMLLSHLSISKLVARPLLVGILVAGLSGCATPPKDPEAYSEWKAINDPLEPMNRGVFEVNMFLDGIILKPVAQGYRWVLPNFLRSGVKNALDNLGEPLNAANSLLQGDFSRASTALGRLLINTTVGLAGLIDVAETIALRPVQEDFGQTLAVWGLENTPYLVLPLIGPSSIRDGIGKGIEFFVDPTTIALENSDLEWVNWTLTAVDIIERRSRHIETLDDIERNSVDFYAAVRSLYRQRRDDLIHNGNAPETDPFYGNSPDLRDDSELSSVN